MSSRRRVATRPRPVAATSGRQAGWGSRRQERCRASYECPGCPAVMYERPAGADEYERRTYRLVTQGLAGPVHLSPGRKQPPLCGADDTYRVMWWSQMTAVCVACRATSDLRRIG